MEQRQMDGEREGEGEWGRDRGFGGEGQAGDRRTMGHRELAGTRGTLRRQKEMWEMEDTGLVGKEVVG